MNTKVILHGGNSSKKSEDNEKFFYEVINSVDSDIVRILCIYFARPEHRWEDSYAEDQSIFFSLETPKEIETKMANYDMEELLEEIEEADIIFINGGRSGHLKETLEKIGDFPNLIAGKVLVGISAGANILSKYYYSNVADEIRTGIGLLPVKLFTHYTGEDDKNLERLEKYGEDIPVLKVPEEQYVVLNDSLTNSSERLKTKNEEYLIDYMGNHQEFSKEIAELWTKEWSDQYSEEKVAEKAKKNISLYSSQKPPFILVAYHDEELLGTSALLLNELKSRPEYNIWVGGVLVKPEFRGNGIAKKLTEAAQVKAKELGYCKIFLKTEHAQGLYEKLGWKHFEKTVNDDGSSTDVYTKDL